MLKMRLQRIGRKNNPSYRVIVTDSRNAPSRGLPVDQVGTYEPRLDRVEIDAEKVKKWLGHGVQASDTVHNLLITKKIIEGKKRNALSRKSPIIDEAKIKAEAEAKAVKEAKALAAAEAAKVAEAEEAKAAEEAAAAPVVEETPAVEEVATEAEVPAAEDIAAETAPEAEEAKA
jgi:small subunit ribosomal protein S16